MERLTYFPSVKSRDTTIETVRPTDNPDLIWDPTSHDVIAWGDVIAYNVDAADLPSVVDRTAAIRALKQFSTRSPQVMRVAPDDRQHHRGQNIEINVSDVGARVHHNFQCFGRWHHSNAVSDELGFFPAEIGNPQYYAPRERAVRRRADRCDHFAGKNGWTLRKRFRNLTSVGRLAKSYISCSGLLSLMPG